MEMPDRINTFLWNKFHLNSKSSNYINLEVTHIFMVYYFVGVVLLGGMLIIYVFQKFLPFILLLVHSFWIPQIVTNVVHGPYKPLHPYYIIGMSVTRLAIPLYIFGCPHNFMSIKPEKK